MISNEVAARAVYAKVMSKFNRRGLKEEELKARVKPRADGRIKYFNCDFEFSTKSSFAVEMGLHKAQHLNILDISGGMGYFAYICRALGHSVVMTDIPDEIFDEPLKKIFGFSKIIFGYPGEPWRFKPLPTDIGTFNVISSLSVIPMSDWNSDSWTAFIDDCMLHLYPQGLLYIRPNYSPGLSELQKMAPKNRFYKSHNSHGATFIKR